MATAIGTTNIALSELETAPGGSVSAGSNISFETSGRQGWNLGIAGSNSPTYNFYTWGYGNGGGGGYLNPIYGLTPPTTGTNPPLELSDWSGLKYWFDGAGVGNFDITLKYQNNQTPAPPPPPAVFDAVSVAIVITDSSGNISIFDKNMGKTDYFINFQAAPGQSQAQAQIPGFQNDAYPLAKNLYWYIQVNAQADFTGGAFEFFINGTSVLFDNLPPGPINNTLYDWTSNTAGVTNSGGCALEFTIG